MGCRTSSLIFAKIGLSINKQSYKRNSLKLIVQIKFGQNLWSHYFKGFSMSYVTISKMRSAVLSVWYLLKSNFRQIETSGSPDFKSDIKNKLWDYQFKMLAFSFQSRDYLKNVDCSTFSLIFSNIDLSINKQP